MTSKQSSGKLFRASFAEVLRRYWVMPVLVFVQMLFYTCSETISNIYSCLTMADVPDAAEYVAELRTAYVFNIADQPGILVHGGFCALLGFLSMLLASFIFRFCSSRSAVNVYLSLGITRGKLFASRFLAGAVLLFAATVLPLGIAAAINMWFYGSAAVLWQAFVFYALSFAAVAEVAFALTALCTCATGAAREGFVYAGVLSALPFSLQYMVYSLQCCFVKGTAFKGEFLSLQSGSYAELDACDTTWAFLSFYMPVDDGRFASGMSARAGEVWSSPGFSYPVFWLLAAAALFAAGMLVFRRRPAEYAGFTGKSPVTVAFSAATLALLFGAVPLQSLAENAFFPEWRLSVYYFLTAAFSLAVFFGLPMLSSLRSVKQTLRLWRFPVVALAACAGLWLLIITDVFGFEKRVPAVADIESVSISLPCGEGLAAPWETWSTFTDVYEDEDIPEDETMPTFLSAVTGSGYYDGYLEDATDPETIAIALQLHKALLATDAGDEMVYNKDVFLSYTLKNGRTIQRVYNQIRFSDLVESLSLLHTQAYKETLCEVLDTEYNAAEHFLCIFSKNLTTLTYVPTIDENGKTELMQAVIADVRAGNLPPDFVSDRAPLGNIFLVNSFDEENGDGEVYDGSDAFTLYSRIDNKQIKEELREAKAPVSFSAAALQESFALVCTSDSCACLPVYASMENTLAFLEANNLTQYFTDAAQPVRAWLLPCNDIAQDYPKRRASDSSWASLEFAGAVAGVLTRSRIVDDAMQTSSYTLRDFFPENATVVEDAQELARLAESTFYRCYINEPGTFVCYEMSDGSYTVGFLPQARGDSDS